MEESNRKQSLGSVILFGLIACLLYGLGAGLRSDIGILLEHTGLQYNDVSMCIAVMQLVFGAAQPVFGMIASKKSKRFQMLPSLDIRIMV